MSGSVARIEWNAQDFGTGKAESGTSLVAAQDVKIARRTITRANQLMTEAMRDFDPSTQPSEAEFQAVFERVMNAPNADEVVAVWYQKFIPLSPDYHLAYCEYCIPEKEVSFGLHGGLGPIELEAEGCSLTFSWEWFCGEEPNRSYKLQEEGSISFEQAPTECGLELTRMVFDTDVSLRISRRSDVDIHRPAWRVNILAGSEIRWPSLFGEAIVPNRFV